ncbi:MAG: YggT family protein [Anaerolineaceae bacterium]|nr:YggT family protein [Anaerolineaceae bacterium]
MHTIIRTIFSVFTTIIIIDVFMSFILPPYNRIRQILDSIVNPLLAPIRRIVPPINNLDFSPIVLLIIIYILEYLILALI